MFVFTHQQQVISTNRNKKAKERLETKMKKSEGISQKKDKEFEEQERKSVIPDSISLKKQNIQQIFFIYDKLKTQKQNKFKYYKTS
ncbi:hypothetical protein TTHERM_00062640 (macronuclear) [Tetrahymena thermophila SB210]|uniref:Uncharacterized protein n=1 Tax=Tetrahymena thermophila (strain SB210) TaxID=312017 RepID=I7M0F1_TETTS|nr:hypothetical protein TTHERM_00062640 [Tetrahymena thermophila SB210]EAR87454.1 hypothetical protein TTHERM_00062640 [Tetrahymena thermophila SB210]|eukprot:XP_001007699.1 hypothetical protein TTHERM_00062640 [Tetrahymena thermophila SB210]